MMFYWLLSFTLCLGFESHLMYRSLTFYADLIKWANGLARQQASMMCLGQSCGPRASGPCLAIV
ncbi:hypothetical protein Zm00014a_005335 [Zea mays]|uniref:Uncharacterized protein n=1 Tax=Zea mays TaxID=4577 RepID=A0A3L6FF54_MAIZE|nr:hypothetical protein Zm00014a_005335 [Zea mays]